MSKGAVNFAALHGRGVSWDTMGVFSWPDDRISTRCALLLLSFSSLSLSYTFFSIDLLRTHGYVVIMYGIHPLLFELTAIRI
jgi:hypothetical protein